MSSVTQNAGAPVGAVGTLVSDLIDTAAIRNVLVFVQFRIAAFRDTINFFAKYDAQSPIKFVHLVPADTGLNFRLGFGRCSPARDRHR
jgi:hypothetical protein